MSEIVVENTPKKVTIAAFARRDTRAERIEQEEKELKELQETVNKKADEESNSDDEEPSSPEEKSFKKRYGDLRRHSQQQQVAMQKQIDELKQQLEKTTANQIKLPKTEAELAEWANAYPDVAKIVETIAIKKAKEQAKAIEDRLKSLDERERQTVRDKAEAELMRLHPDFDQIRDSDEFHEWVEQQPKWVQAALYENDEDAKAAARAIDLYKSDKKISSKPSSSREAAMSVKTRGTRSAPSGSGEDGVFYESQVAKMSSREYESMQEDIAKAIRSGKFVYDLSGSAR